MASFMWTVVLSLARSTLLVMLILPRGATGIPLAVGLSAADRGYLFPSVRAEVRRRRVGAVIPHQVQPVPRVHWLKQFRRVATGYEKRGCNYLAMVKLAAAQIWL